MRERLVEDWLTKVNERNFEIPFCHMLCAEGHTVVHLSRHGPMEQGKDVLAIEPQGVPCAYQLKCPSGRRLTQSEWDRDIRDQAIRLVELPISHPSIDDELQHKPYLVINGELDEVVREEIADRNEQWENRGFKRLQVITRLELLGRLNALGSDFWPVELAEARSLLELYLADGQDFLPKARLAAFLEAQLPFSEPETSRAELSRTIAALGILTSYALFSFEEEQNHLAVIEGWVVYVATVTALVKKKRLPLDYHSRSIELAETAIERALSSLVEELDSRDHYYEGDALFDGEFYRTRMTFLVGLAALGFLWPAPDEQSDELSDAAAEFLEEHRTNMLLWGEGAIPHFLAAYWALRPILATAEPDHLLGDLIAIITARRNDKHIPLPSPYASAAKVIAQRIPLLDLDEDRPGLPLPDQLTSESYSLESLVHLFARRNWKRRMKSLWPGITRMSFCSMRPPARWQTFRWHCEEGTVVIREPKHTQSWQELRDTAAEADYSWVPPALRRRPHLVLLFLMTYPHRLCPDLVKLVDDAYA